MFQISETWARQPTTLIGLAVSLGSVALMTMGKIDAATAAVMVTSGLGLMGIDDNTEAGRDVRALVADGVAAATPGHLTAVLPKLVQDGVALALRGVNEKGGLTIRYGDPADSAAALKRALAADRSPAPLLQPVPMPASQVTIEPPDGPGPGPGARVLPVLAICAALGLAACGAPADQRAAVVASDIGLACRVDQALQPVTAAVVTATVPMAGAALTVDQMAVHPAVVAFCAGLGGTVMAPLPAAPVAAKP